MKYFKLLKKDGAQAVEITKDEARETLAGYWKAEYIKEIFENGEQFRLYTPYSEVWTMGDDGLTPMAGFYGVAG